MIRSGVARLFGTVLGFSVALLAAAQTSSTSGQLQSCAGIMPLGDSITVGPNGGYRNELYSGLQENNCGVSYAGTQVDPYTRVSDKHHEGHPYFSIGDIRDNIDGWLNAAQPAIVILMVGTNDIAAWTAETAEQIGVRHNALIDRIRTVRPDAWIFVASIPPQTPALVPPNNVDRGWLTTEFNAIVRRNVETRAAAGQRVRFVDINAALTTADLADDGIHPKEAVYPRIGQKFLEAIRFALGSSSPPTLQAAVTTAAPTPPSAPATPPTPLTPSSAPPTAPSKGGGAIGWFSLFLLVGCLLRRLYKNN